MLIIFEGSDNSGKTTIAKELEKTFFTFQYFKHAKQKKDFFDLDRASSYTEAYFLIDLLKQISLDLIVDRHIMSEYAYSMVYCRSIEFKQIWKIDHQLAKMSAAIIYCEKTEYKNYNDDIISKHSIKSLQHWFHKYLKQTRIPHLKLDTTDENLPAQINTITEFLTDLWRKE